MSDSGLGGSCGRGELGRSVGSSPCSWADEVHRRGGSLSGRWNGRTRRWRRPWARDQEDQEDQDQADRADQADSSAAMPGAGSAAAVAVVVRLLMNRTGTA